MFNKGFESLIARPTSNSLAAGESQMSFKKSQDQLQNGQSTVFQKASGRSAITLQLRSSATKSRKLATTATRSVIEAITLMSRRAATRSPQHGTTATRSVIESWLMMCGNIQSEGEIQIDGKIKGNIRCTRLIVGKDATIIGDIVAEEIVVRGCVKGTVRADRVILQSTACVTGEIFHKLFSAEEGAAFDGQFHRTAEPVKATGKAEKWLTELQAMAQKSMDRPSGELTEATTISVAA
jgi:cytoskeletal protein CcmA (bactofilin family)